MRCSMLVAAVLLLAAPSAVSAAPSDLDPTFGPGAGGVQQIPFNQGPTEGVRTALEPDGTIVVVGTRNRSSVLHEWVAARLDANGTALDATFNGNGKSNPVATATDVGGTGAESVAIEPGGNILVGGHTNGNLAKITVGRLHGDGTSDGSADVGFGPGGTATITVTGAGEADVRALALQPDGRILAGGDVLLGGHRRPFVARFTSGGQPDLTFDATEVGPDGVVFIPDAACDDVLQADCDGGAMATATAATAVTAIYLGGGNVQGNLLGGRVWKLAPTSGQDGFAVETSFGAPSTPGGAQIERHLLQRTGSIVLTPDGRIVVAGTAQDAANSSSCGIARLDPSGGTDATFAGEHNDPNGATGTCVLSEMVRQPDGKFVFSGSTYDQIQGAGTPGLALGRWTADGHADATFAPAGSVVRGLGGAPNYGAGLTLQAGKPLVTGVSGSPAVMSLGRFQGGDLPATGGGGGTDGGGAAPSVLPRVVGRGEVGSTLYCNPGSLQGTLNYTWFAIAPDGSGAHSAVGTGPTFRVTTSQEDFNVECFVVISGQQVGYASSNRVRIAHQTPVMIFPSFDKAVPDYLPGTRRCGAKGYCLPEEVHVDLERQQVHLDWNTLYRVSHLSQVPRAFRHDLAYDTVVGLDVTPGDGTHISSGPGKVVTVQAKVYEPKLRDPGRCPFGVDLVTIDDRDLQLQDVLQGMALKPARALLLKENCFKLDAHGDETDVEYSIAYKEDRKTLEPRVTSASIKKDPSAPHKKLVALVVKHPPADISLGIIPERRSHAVSLGLGDAAMTVDDTQPTAFGVHVGTTTGNGISGAKVEVRDRHGLTVDNATTDAGGVAHFRTVADTPGTYEIWTSVTDRDDESLVGWQDIRAVKRGDAPFTDLTGQSLAASKGTYKPRGVSARAAGVSATESARLETILSGMQQELDLLDRWLPRQQANFGVFFRGTLQQVLAAGSAATAVKFDLAYMTAHRCLCPQMGSTVGLQTLGSTIPLGIDLPDPQLTTALVFDGRSILSQAQSSIDPGAGAVTVSNDGFTVLPDGGFTISKGVGNLISGGGSTFAETVIKANQLNVIALGAAGGGTAISHDGGSLIANDGGTLLSEHGAGLLAGPGGRVISNDGNSLITNDGGALISNDGGTLVSDHGFGR